MYPSLVKGRIFFRGPNGVFNKALAKILETRRAIMNAKGCWRLTKTRANWEVIEDSPGSPSCRTSPSPHLFLDLRASSPRRGSHHRATAELPPLYFEAIGSLVVRVQKNPLFRFNYETF